MPLLKQFLRLLLYPFGRLLYWFARFLFGPGLFLTGCRRGAIGTCVILAPLNKLPFILQGFVYLQSVDPEMYRRLTAKNRFIFWYIHKLPLSSKKQLRFREIYTITDNSLSWGNEGVAICLVQTVLRNDFPTNFVKGSKEHLAASLMLKQQIFEWVKGRSLSPELVEHYQKAVEKM